MTEIKVHPAAESARLLREDELAVLAADIEANGLRDPLTLGRVNGRDFDQLVDGRNRLRACEAAGIELRFETLAFENDDEVKAFVLSRKNRLDMSKGARAMQYAMLYPIEQAKGGRGKKGSDTQRAAETAGVSHRRIQEARQVNAHSPELAEAVKQETLTLDDALAKVKADRQSIESNETKLARLRAEAPDLAELVAEERLSLTEANEAFEQRRRDEAASEDSKRETLLRLSEAAYRGTIAWANEEFATDIRDRLTDGDFHRRLIDRLRIDKSSLTDIQRGAKALAAVLTQIAKKGSSHE